MHTECEVFNDTAPKSMIEATRTARTQVQPTQTSYQAEGLACHNKKVHNEQFCRYCVAYCGGVEFKKSGLLFTQGKWESSVSRMPGVPKLVLQTTCPF